MERDSFATYPPLDTLKSVADDVWIVDGPTIRFGAPLLKMPFLTRMTIMAAGTIAALRTSCAARSAGYWDRAFSSGNQFPLSGITLRARARPVRNPSPVSFEEIQSKKPNGFQALLRA